MIMRDGFPLASRAGEGRSKGRFKFPHPNPSPTAAGEGRSKGWFPPRLASRAGEGARG